MAPKKGKKMALNEFLGDNTLGSWADEMDSLPTAPSNKVDGDDRGGLGRRGDDRFDRGPTGPPREDLPLPTRPPYTAFVGNLAFDLTESELEDFFAPVKTKTAKIIKDREEKPKGFGYVEFEDLEGLKDALARSGTPMSGRTVRVSVAEPPKERTGFGGGGFDDEAKFDNPWRRDGPLPDLPGRDSSRRRFDAPPGGDRPGPAPGASETASAWRSSRPSPRIPPAELDPPPFARRPSGLRGADSPSAADTEETWSKGSKFKPAEELGERKFGSFRGRGDMGPPREGPPPSAVEESGPWRSARPRLDSTSPTGSTPPTPQMGGRRKLELLPRSNSSATPSPLSSPRMGPSTSGSNTPRSNPFGEARPVDVSAKEKAVAERLEKDREVTKERTPALHSMSRNSSRAGSDRATRAPNSPRLASPTASTPANVRPAVSFANAAGAAKESAGSPPAAEIASPVTIDSEMAPAVESVTEKLGEVAI